MIEALRASVGVAVPGWLVSCLLSGLATAGAADLVVRGTTKVIDSNTSIRGSVWVEDGGVLIIRDARLTLRLDYDEQYHIDVSDDSKLVVDNGEITSTGGQYWFELYGDGERNPTLEVDGDDSWLTNHSGIRPYDAARIVVTGGDVEELQVRDRVTVELSDAATYPVFFFDGTAANLSNLDTGPDISNTISVPGGWSFSLSHADVEGYQIDLMNGAAVNLEDSDGIVASIHTPGDLGDELQIVEGITADEPISGATTNLGSQLTFTNSNIALLNVYTFGSDRVLLRDLHVNEVNAEATSELIIGQKGYPTVLNCNLCQVYDRATFTAVEATIDASDNVPSATSSYADVDLVGRGVMSFVNMDLRELYLTARESGVLELRNSPIDPAKLDQEDATAEVSQENLVADFTATRLSGETPLSVQFLDLSAGDVRSYLWTFGDGTGAALQNPVHVYGAPGSYGVSLTVNGPAGGDTENKSSYIRVEQGGVVTPCVEGTETLCLSDDRFRVEVRWRDFDGNTGSGRMVPFGS
ncbi:MAG: PKD domain-containing protein, partial [bacterium]|nr:PKD domain-containing protein [bacterium]